MSVTRPRILALLDGTLVDPDRPIVLADDLGVVRGDGVFETLHAQRDGARDTDQHLDRLAASASILDLPAPDARGYRRAIAAVIGAWDWAREPEAMLRLVQTRGREGAHHPNGWALGFPIDAAIPRQRRDGVRVLLLDRGFEGAGIAPLPWLLPGAKTLSYGVNMAAKRYAVAHGADDAIFVTPSGAVLEGPTSAVVVDIDGELVTPPIEGILDSITVGHLRREGPSAGLELHTHAVTRDELLGARGAWLLSSSRIMARVVRIDGEPYPTSPLDTRLAEVLAVPGAGQAGGQRGAP